jgi:outer membrane protein TolC
MNISQHLPRLRPLAVGIAALVLSGCASFSKDGGLDTVSALTKERTGQSVAFSKPGANTEQAENTVTQLLGKPLTPDTAVQVALLNNRGLRASLAQLGIAEADLVQAGRMRNPRFSFGRMAGGDAVEIDRSVMFDIVGLLTIPVRSNIERRSFEIAKLEAASQAVRLAAETRRAYFNAVAAQQTALYAEQVRSSAEASAELAQRMAKVGNFSKLDQMREQAFYADASAQLARARRNATAAREQLSRLMGVWGAKTAFNLPDRLPDLPATPRAVERIEAQAMQQRLDVHMARRDAEMTASSLGLSKATGLINVLHAGYANKSTSGAPRENGYEIELELPIFDWGGSRIAKAEAIYMQSVERTADTAIRARSEAREAYSAYRTTFDLAKHYRDEVIPLRKKISEETLLRYNGMLISVFELLADSRAQINSVNAAIEAQRDFWLAETDLQAAINGTGGSALQMRASASGNAAPAH